MLQSEIKVNKEVNGENALLAATQEGHAEVVRVLLKHSDIDTNIVKRGKAGNALFIASEMGHSEIVKELLLQPQTDVNNRFGNENMTALEIASNKGYDNVMKIVTWSVMPKIIPWTPLCQKLESPSDLYYWEQ